MVITAAVLSSLLRSADAAKNVTECPNGCLCELTSSDSRLTVTCDPHQSDVDAEQTSRQLDSMLSSEQMTASLTSLTVTNASLTRVPASVCALRNLNTLNLNGNNLSALPDNCLTAMKMLVTFSAVDNAIVGLQDALFDGLQNLVTLNLSSNEIAYIGLRVFSNASDLVSLRYVNLDFNQLTSLEPWWYYRCIHGSISSPVTITLEVNRITNFTNEIKFDFRCGMKVPFGRLNLRENEITHVTDIFHGWNIETVSQVLCLQNRQVRRAHMVFDIGGHNYACDCRDFLFYKVVKIFPHISLLNGVRCSDANLPSSFPQHELAIAVPLNVFVCEWSDRCPSSCRCVYRPANATLHVYCSASNLSSLPLDLPPLPKSYVRYKLDFSNNKLLQRLEHRSYFVNTSILDVSNCSLNEIGSAVWEDLSHMKIANLRGNMIQLFPQHVNMNISTSLFLGANPWRCSCDSSSIIGSLQSLSDRILDPGDIICRSPTRMYGRNVLKSTEEDFCVDPVKRTLTITLSTVASISFLVVLTGVLVYKLRVKFYRRWKFHPFDRDECVGEDMDYDVFLCCSSMDYDPHGRHVLELIESNGYRVCYHDRDFLPGTLITANMTESVERSKRTLCLLSNNFMQR